MAGLQRSEISFRRQGSSGLVWDDKSFLSGELIAQEQDQEKPKAEQHRQEEATQINAKPREPSSSRSAVIRSAAAYRTVKGPPAATDPPSPKLSGCGFCAIFGKPVQPKATQAHPHS
ncbi:uncharacterized protein At1g15400 [Malania oleifera]|uniref:uncharacterized protein At1g15400 n=1 Tax=Malania oleifera TaxID=397392 RepID=UPI0025AE428C|nr:uncharacterized protein At1g15400 [Malania oleifera]